MRHYLLIVTILFFSGYSDLQAYAEKPGNQSAVNPKPDNRQYKLLQRAVERYERIKARHDWPPLVMPARSVLKLNDTSPLISVIKERLELLGDIRRPGPNPDFTLKLEVAVKTFQLRHGLDDDGIVGPAFIKALNVPLDKRIQQMQVNMERIRLDTMDISGKRIVANIPEYKLYVYENSKEVLSMDIVVGKITNPTIIFSDTLENVVFSPYWNVPASIVKNEILPEINKGTDYLARNNMEITGKLDGLPIIRQKPGPENSLGNVKFLFPNQYDIYFHDTPSKSLFERKNRAFSHGCIRLSEPKELAKYLLQDQSEWTDEKILDAMNAGKEKWVKLREAIPVSIIYYTAWVDQWGNLNFRDDIYGHDQEQQELSLMDSN